MTVSKNLLNNLLIGLTVVLLSIFIYTQFRVFQDNIKITKTQLELNTLHGRIENLNKSLSMSAHSFVLTRDEKGIQSYQLLQRDYQATLLRIYTLLSYPADRRKELSTSYTRLLDIEARAFELAQNNRTEEAKSLLFGSDYLKLQSIYEAGLKQLTDYLDTRVAEMMSLHYENAINTSIARIVIVLILVFGWYRFIKTSKKWQKKINEANQSRAKEAIEAAQKLKQANDQLQHLSAHLQDLREKERLALASEINEELGQQIAALQVRISTIQKSMRPADKSQVAELHEVSVQLGEALNFLRKLATDVYPLVLRDLGLIEALHWESERNCTKIVNVKFYSAMEDLEVDQRTATHLFRSYQEKLQNLVSSGATEIRGSLHLDNGHLLLTIRDNAEFSFKTGNKTMDDMVIKERLRTIQGHSEVISSPKEGNCFTISIPYSVNNN